MALTVDTGIVNANTGSATTTITVTAQGKAIILFTTGQTAEGSDSAANAMFSFGFSDGTFHRCIAWASDDNVGTTNCGSTWRATAAIEVLSNGTPTSLVTATVAFTNATTTTLTFSGTPAAAYKIGYIQFGGSDITNVLVSGATLVSGSTADVVVSSPGFQPDFAMFIGTQATAAGTITRALGTVGFASHVDKEVTMAWGIDDGANMTANIDAVSYTNSAASMSQITAGAETVDFLANLKSFDANGFTLAVTNAASAAWQFGYLVIKGGQWDVGTTTPVSGGTRTISGMTFQPKGLFLAHTTADADATVDINATSGVGAASSTSTEASAAARQQDAQLNTNVFRDTQSANIQTQPGGTASTSFDGFTSDGWAITSGGLETPTWQTGWFAAGDNAVAPTTTGDGWTGKGGWW